MVNALMLFDTGTYKNTRRREGWNETSRKRAEVSKEGSMRSDVAPNALAQHTSPGLAHAARGMLAQFDARIIESLPNSPCRRSCSSAIRTSRSSARPNTWSPKIPGSTPAMIADAGHLEHRPARGL